MNGVHTRHTLDAQVARTVHPPGLSLHRPAVRNGVHDVDFINIQYFSLHRRAQHAHFYSYTNTRRYELLMYASPSRRDTAHGSGAHIKCHDRRKCNACAHTARGYMI